MANTKKAVKEKPLEKMTAKDLRDVAKEIPEIAGVYGMNKPELMTAIKKSRGIEEVAGKKSDASVRDTKKKIKKLKRKRESALTAADGRMASIYRRKISRLKKKTRKAA